jgi:hypothetical protein
VVKTSIPAVVYMHSNDNKYNKDVVKGIPSSLSWDTQQSNLPHGEYVGDTIIFVIARAFNDIYILYADRGDDTIQQSNYTATEERAYHHLC